jgi:transposase InsO family protein
LATGPGHPRRLQRQLDRFRRYYNTVRPHRSIERRTPEHAYTAPQGQAN